MDQQRAHQEHVARIGRADLILGWCELSQLTIRESTAMAAWNDRKWPVVDRRVIEMDARRN